MSAVLSAIVAHRTAYATYTTAIDANPSDSLAVLKAGDAERAAIDALFAAPVSSLSDVTAKAAYFADEVDELGDYFGEEGGQPLASFLQSLRMSSAAIQPDPLAVLIADYRRQVEISNAAEEGSPEASSWRKPFEALSVDSPPQPTSLAGVLAAIQLVAHEEEIGPSNMTVGVLKAAAAFLEGQAVPIQPDPLLEIVTRYRSQLVAFNTPTGKTDAEANAMRDATWGAFEEGVADGTINLPSPTTLAGAAAALRCALEEDTTHAVSDKLRDVALAFLEGGAATVAVVPDPMLALIAAYKDGLKVYNVAPSAVGTDEDNALAERVWRPHYDTLRSTPPTPSTLAGAIEAIRLVAHEEEYCGNQEDLTINVLKAALAFFEGKGA